MPNEFSSNTDGIAYASVDPSGPTRRPFAGSNDVARFLLEGKPPDQVAMESLQGFWTFRELDSASCKIANFLLSSGGRKGDRALLVAENSYFWVATYLGILRAGLVAVPLPLTTSSEELAFIVTSTDSRFAFVDTGFDAKHSWNRTVSVIANQSRLCPDGRVNLHTFDQVLRTDSAALPVVDSRDLAALMYTSGSTGKPRGVMVTHGNIIANTRSIVESLHLSESDSMFTVLPFHYCFGTSLLHTHLAVGGRLVLDNRFMYPESVLQHLKSSRCTGFAGVPSHYQILLRRSSIRGMSFPYLRHVQQAGGHLAPAFLRELREALPNVEVFVMYGQTEATARLSCVPAGMLDQKIGSIGRAIPGVKLSVVDEQGIELQPGEPGEIVAEGANITIGYWREPEESLASFRNGKLHTGDMAIVDEDGFIYIVDRVKDFVKVGGTRTGCRSIEEQMLEFSELLEVAVVGIPDPVLGEALKAFVVPRDRKNTFFTERFRDFCAEHLPFQIVPREIVQLDTLPKNSAGKVLKSVLKGM